MKTTVIFLKVKNHFIFTNVFFSWFLTFLNLLSILNEGKIFEIFQKKNHLAPDFFWKSWKNDFSSRNPFYSVLSIFRKLNNSHFWWGGGCISLTRTKYIICVSYISKTKTNFYIFSIFFDRYPEKYSIQKALVKLVHVSF